MSFPLSTVFPVGSGSPTAQRALAADDVAWQATIDFRGSLACALAARRRGMSATLPYRPC